MATIAGSSIFVPSRSCVNQATTKISSLKSVSLSTQRKNFPSLRLHQGPSQFRVSCAAKLGTVEKVCEIVKKQLALPPNSTVTGESKFAALGADSLDTVEIVMGLEEEFGICVDEDSAQTIETVQDAADMIDKIIENKGE